MITLIVKVTLVLLIGAAVAGALRNRPAATRHFVWTLTLAATLLLLAIAPVAPRMTVTIPYGVADEVRTIRTTTESPSPALWNPPSRVRREGRRNIEAGVVVWAVGSVSVLAWWFAGFVGLTRIARSATRVSGGRVRIASSAAVAAPVTWGWLRPIVVLPAGSDSWPHDRRRAALLHELAHVARHDALAQLVATLACALYWFHPMVWIAARRLRATAEHASDDRVLDAGMTAADYAAHLLAVAATRCHGTNFALGMACPSNLESRVRAVLDETRERGAASRRMRFAAAALVAVTLVPLAASRTELRAAPRPKGPESVVERAVDAAPGETLILDLETGASVDIRGTNEPRVNVRASLRGRDAADARVNVARTSNGVRVTSDYVGSRNSHSTSIALEIRVPARFDVRLDSSGGGMTIADVDGTFTGNTGGGSFTLTRLEGRAKLTTGGGDVNV
ncbi:MAG TPA: M56 family metallopeptidase, partial [Thermoanaerobaculia bacterium]|nr:M56 family metallopeptidase [Thermoanaerobaculia bacterium]